MYGRLVITFVSLVLCISQLYANNQDKQLRIEEKRYEKIILKTYYRNNAKILTVGKCISGEVLQTIYYKGKKVLSIETGNSRYFISVLGSTTDNKEIPIINIDSQKTIDIASHNYFERYIFSKDKVLKPISDKELTKIKEEVGISVPPKKNNPKNDAGEE